MAVSNAFAEDERDYRISLGRKDSTATRGFWFPWAQRVPLALEFLGGHQSDGFHMPRRHLDFPGLVVERVEMFPVTPDLLSGSASQDLTAVRSELGKMMVFYRNLPVAKEKASSSSTVDDELGRVEMEYSAEMLTLKSSRWRWNAGDKDGDDLNDSEVQPYKVIPLKTIVLTLNENQEINTDNLHSSIGKVNKDAWAGHDCETLMLMGARTTRILNPSGFEFEQGEVRFGYKKSGWNAFWDGKAFSKIHNIDAGAAQTTCGTRCGSLVYDCFLVTDIITRIEVLE